MLTASSAWKGLEESGLEEKRSNCCGGVGCVRFCGLFLASFFLFFMCVCVNPA